jgi:hypothetical protein
VSRRHAHRRPVCRRQHRFWCENSWLEFGHTDHHGEPCKWTVHSFVSTAEPLTIVVDDEGDRPLIRIVGEAGPVLSLTHDQADVMARWVGRTASILQAGRFPKYGYVVAAQPPEPEDDDEDDDEDGLPVFP